MTDLTTLMNEDRSSRERIVSATDANLFVEASAGSGKTSKLVDRMVAMVENGIDIRRICAITFTINSAREFYSRFRDELAKKSTDESIPEEKRRRFSEALENIDLCFMGTIDSFCQMVLSEHPLEAGIPSGTTVTSEDEMNVLYRQELAAAANGEYGPELAGLYGRLSSAVYKADEKILEQLPWFTNTLDVVKIYDRCEDFEELMDRETPELLEILAKVDGHPELCNDGNDDAKKAIAAVPKYHYILGKNWKTNISGVSDALRGLKDLRLVCAPEAMGVEDICGLFEQHTGRGKWFDCKINEPGHAGYALSEYIYSLFMEFCDRFSREASDRLASEGYLSFYGYQYCLLRLLRRDIQDGGKLISHISGRHSYFLIDEFQDTDPIQAEIFFYLSANEPAADWRQCVPRPGSLFIVGDPKQSIYRFRNADVESYLDVKRLFSAPAGETLNLYRNFRSTREMTDAFNGIYCKILPSEDTASQCRFEPIPSDTEPDAGDSVSGVFSYVTDGMYPGTAEQVADIIRHIVANPEIRIYNPREGSSRTVDYRDIMVITRGKSSLDVFIKSCTAAGIPVYAEGKTVFSDCRAMHMISAVLSAVTDPGSGMKAYNALTCGVFDISDLMLSEYCLADGALRLRSFEMEIPDDDGYPVITAALNSLAPLVRLAGSASPSAIYSRIINSLPVFEKAGTLHLDYVFYALELLKAGECDGSITDSREAAAYIADIISGDMQIERSMNLQNRPNCVHFANLHKVKGLEAPVVILADPVCYTRNDPKRRIERSDGERRAYMFRAGQTSISSKKYAERREAEKLCYSAELDRLLYVAGTRCGNILIVPKLLKTEDNKRSRNYWAKLEDTAETDISDIYGGFEPELIVREQFSIPEASARAAQECVLDAFPADEKTYRILRPSRFRVLRKAAEDDGEGAEQPEDDETPEIRPDAALIGTMAHRAMEILVSTKGRTPSADICRMVLSEYSFSSERAEEYRGIISDVLETVRSGGYTQANGTPADILAETEGADELFCELPFCYHVGSAIFHGVMDLVYLKDGVWHIVDYKTSADPDDLDAKYTEQLRAYTEAFRALTGNTAEAVTYHIDI